MGMYGKRMRTRIVREIRQLNMTGMSVACQQDRLVRGLYGLPVLPIVAPCGPARSCLYDAIICEAFVPEWPVHPAFFIRKAYSVMTMTECCKGCPI